MSVPDRLSAECCHCVKSEFVGEVISDENGRPSLERRLLQVVDDRRTLVAPLRAQFQDPFSALYMPTDNRRVSRMTAKRAMNERCKRRRAAIVDGESGAFVLEQQTLVTRGEAPHVLAQLRELGGRALVSTNRAVRGTTFAAMQSRDKQPSATKQPVDVGERAPRDERHRAAQGAAE